MSNRPSVSHEAIAAAVVVLNLYNHRDSNTWYVWGTDYIANERDRYDVLDQFEAVAIAEKYMRDFPKA